MSETDLAPESISEPSLERSADAPEVAIPPESPAHEPPTQSTSSCLGRMASIAALVWIVFSSFGIQAGTWLSSALGQ